VVMYYSLRFSHTYLLDTYNCLTAETSIAICQRDLRLRTQPCRLLRQATNEVMEPGN
jgi:hypothetical protein